MYDDSFYPDITPEIEEKIPALVKITPPSRQETNPFLVNSRCIEKVDEKIYNCLIAIQAHLKDKRSVCYLKINAYKELLSGIYLSGFEKVNENFFVATIVYNNRIFYGHGQFPLKARFNALLKIAMMNLRPNTFKYYPCLCRPRTEPAMGSRFVPEKKQPEVSPLKILEMYFGDKKVNFHWEMSEVTPGGKHFYAGTIEGDKNRYYGGGTTSEKAIDAAAWKVLDQLLKEVGRSRKEIEIELYGPPKDPYEGFRKPHGY